MAETIESFLKNSTIAEKVELKTKIIVHRTKINTIDYMNMKNNQQFGSFSSKEEICELEIGNKIIAKGKIIIKNGEHYFKIKEIYNSEVK